MGYGAFVRVKLKDGTKHATSSDILGRQFRLGVRVQAAKG